MAVCVCYCVSSLSVKLCSWLHLHLSYNTVTSCDAVLMFVHCAGNVLRFHAITFYYFSSSYMLFPSVLRHCWLGDRKGIQPVKSSVLVCWWWNSDWSFARLTSPVATTTSIILSSNKTQNGDILVLANPGPSGKQPLKRTERESSSYMLWNCS